MKPTKTIPPEGAPRHIQDMRDLIQRLDGIHGDVWALVLLGRHRSTGDLAVCSTNGRDMSDEDPELLRAVRDIVAAYADDDGGSSGPALDLDQPLTALGAMHHAPSE